MKPGVLPVGAVRTLRVYLPSLRGDQVRFRVFPADLQAYSSTY